MVLLPAENAMGKHVMLSRWTLYTEMHYHDYFTGQDMRIYRVARFMMENEEIIGPLPYSISLNFVDEIAFGASVSDFLLSAWEWWLPGSKYEPGYDDYNMYYCIKNFLVFRHRNGSTQGDCPPL